jgi:uncharacterized repeat protein (TIGR01451 family)
MQVARRGRTRWQVGAMALALSIGTLQATPELQVTLEGQVQVLADGEVSWAALADGAEIKPGELIRYQVELANTGDDEATKASALGRIPAGTLYVLESATAGPDLMVEYSIDGGDTYSRQPTIVVEDEHGSKRTVPAPASLYTSIRWTWSDPIPSGDSASVFYQVQVR